jgi:hypothetical protein
LAKHASVKSHSNSGLKGGDVVAIVIVVVGMIVAVGMLVIDGFDAVVASSTGVYGVVAGDSDELFGDNCTGIVVDGIIGLVGKSVDIANVVIDSSPCVVSVVWL